MMQAYDIVLSDEGEQPPEGALPGGWAGGGGPDLGAGWPRGPLTGLPMLHVLTLRLPEEYRRRDPQLVAVSFFQGEGQFAQPDTFDRTDPLGQQVADYEAHRHPQERILSDIIDGQFARVFLTQEELDRGPVAPPPDVRPADHPEPDDEGPNAWDQQEPYRVAWLVPRVDDPNVGIAPADDSDDYTEPYEDEELNERSRGWRSTHLGGTGTFIQAIPDGLTPYYLGIDEQDFTDVNFGSGTAQLDLDNDTFDWACG